MIREQVAGLIGRIRPTAIIFGVLAFIGLIYCIQIVIGMIAKDADAGTIGLMFGAVLLLAGTIGTCAAKAFDDPPPPVVPAAVVNKLIDKSFAD